MYFLRHDVVDALRHFSFGRLIIYRELLVVYLKILQGINRQRFILSHQSILLLKVLSQYFDFIYNFANDRLLLTGASGQKMLCLVGLLRNSRRLNKLLFTNSQTLAFSCLYRTLDVGVSINLILYIKHVFHLKVACLTGLVGDRMVGKGSLQALRLNIKLIDYSLGFGGRLSRIELVFASLFSN